MASIIRRSLFGDTDLEQTAIALLRQHEPEEGYYLANSGGKDSGVLRHLVIKSGVKFDAHYNWTTIDPPELLHHIKHNHPETEIHKPALSMWQLIPIKKMPPTRLVRYCCQVLKEGGGKNRIVLTGVRSAESAARSQRKQVEHVYKGTAKGFVHPLFYWTDAEIWEYTKINNISYCSLYDQGFKRLGCIGCPMQGKEGMERDFKRWPKHKAAYLRAFQKLIDLRSSTPKPALQKTAQEMFDWWVLGKQPRSFPLFEGIL
jgi:phosphoadenosine phosphosulfate reductase